MARTSKEVNQHRRSVIAARYETEGSVPIARDLGVVRDTVLKMATRMGLWYDRVRYQGDKIRAASAKPDSGNKRRAMRSKSCDIHYFDQWSARMAYVLGFVFADGSVNAGKSMVSIDITTEDETVLDFIRDEVKVVAPIRRYGASGTTKPHSKLCICSTVLVAQLESLGVNRRKTFRNDPLPEVPTEYLADFIRGYFDGDGSVKLRTNRTECGISFIGTPTFLASLAARLCDNAGMRPMRLFHFKGKQAEWATVSWTKPCDLRAFADYIYPESRQEFCLERKRRRLLEWLAESRIEMKEWTPEAIETVKRLYSTIGPSKVAAIVGRWASSVRLLAKRLGLKYDRKGNSY